MEKRKIKRIEPAGHDIALKYVCPNPSCLFIHWTSLRESQTKNFKMVCDCGTVFIAKRIRDVTINYVADEKKREEDSLGVVESPADDIIEEADNLDFLEEAQKTLVKFGFGENEAEYMIFKEYEKSGSRNPATLVKMSLDFFGE